MQATRAEEPSEAAWDRILTRLEQLPPPAPRPSFPLRPAGVAAALLATAAAVWAVVALWPRPVLEQNRPTVETVRGVPQHKPRPQVVEPDRKSDEQAPAPNRSRPELESFVVATADEIEIVRVAGADTRTLLVGRLPLLGPMLLAEEGEVVLQSAEPQVRMGEGRPPVLQWVRSSPNEEAP